ncbi:MAG: hypothetical protein JNM80_02010 [Phycisphaerae bacterium]|nr:hypothetical protein [Phycisphaerae bacterium]
MSYKLSLALVVLAGSTAAMATVAPPTNKTDPRIARRIPLPVVPGGHTDAFPFSDNMDSYANGSGIAGQGSWQLWATGSVDGVVSNAQANSAPNSFKQVPQTDIVQLGSVTTGTWELKCMTYCPSANVATTANDGGFIIGLNTWNAANPGGATADYSMQIQWYKGNASGPVVRDYNQNAAGCPVSSTAPIIFDQWVQFRAVINLTTNTYDAYYGATQIVSGKSWTKGVLGCSSATNPPVQIQAFDFYNGTAATAANANDTFYLDDVSFSEVAAPVSCYANCDNSTLVPFLNVNDFICFNNKFAAGDTTANCDGSTLPPVLNVNDFICFNNLFAAGCTAP